MTLPNSLSLIRILLIPIFVIFFYLPFSWTNLATAFIFALAAVTDWFDGYFARKWNQTTPFGAFIDPVADKLMVSVAIVLLVEHHAEAWFTVAAVVIICREIIVSALREWMAELGKRASVAVSYIGKVKTAMQMVALVALLAAKPEQELLVNLGMIAFYIAAALTLWSMFAYLKAAWPELKNGMKR